jgi:hypothetical protein
MDPVIHCVAESFLNIFLQFKVSDDLFVCAIAALKLIFVRDDAFRLSDEFARGWTSVR